MTPHDIEIDDDSPTMTFTPDFAALAFGGRTDGLRVPPAPPPPRRITPIPPPLPTVLRKRISYGDEEWLASLPLASRAILTAAAMPAPPWPHAERIAGAVCTPII